MYKIKHQHKGITLIALVITIVVLLILAGVSIQMLTGDNGIFNMANESKIQTALGALKEGIKLEQTANSIEEKELTPETLLAERKVTRTVKEKEEKYYMYYAIKEDAYSGMQGLGKGNISSLKDVFLIDDNLNVKYISSDGKEYGDKIIDKILKDETEIRFSSKAFSEYVSKISGVTEEKMKFKWMKNQTSLHIADVSIDTLEDLVFFPNLEKLSIGSTSIKEMNLENLAGIENCSKLTELIVEKVIIGSWKEILNLHSLETINIFASTIDDVKGLGSCSNLKNIIFNSIKFNLDSFIDEVEKINNLQKLQITGNAKIGKMEKLKNITSNLKELKLTRVELEDLQGIEKFTNLTTLNLSENKIKDIELISNLVNLEQLFLASNEIKDITPLSNNIKLKLLDLVGNSEIEANRNNYIEEDLNKIDAIGEILDRGGEIKLPVEKLGLFRNYKVLDISNQNLKTIEFLDGMTELTSLDLSNNRELVIDEKSKEILSKMTNLTKVVLTNDTLITDISVFNNMKNMKRLMLGGLNVNLADIEDILSNVTILVTTYSSFKSIENCDPEKITSIKLDSVGNYQFTNLPNLDKFTKLTELVLPGITTDDFSMIGRLANLQKLNLGRCKLHGKKIDFSKMSNLIELNLNNANLWSEDLEMLKGLKNNTNLKLDLRNNAIINATALLELNQNTKIDLRGNTNLSQESKDKLKAKFGNNVAL